MWLLLNDEIEKNIELNGINTRLIKISKATFLVGKNNSGKSYFLRDILKKVIKVYIDKQELLNDLKANLNDAKIENFKDIESLKIKSLCQEYSSMINLLYSISSTKIATGAHYLDGRDTKVYKFDEILINEAKKRLFKELDLKGEEQELCQRLVNNEDKLKDKLNNNFISIVKQNLNDLSDTDLLILGQFLKDVELPYRLKKFYFPVHRMIRHPLKNATKKLEEENNIDILAKRINTEYNFSENINIISGLNFYKEYKRNLLGTKEKREKVAKFEKFLSEYFFENEEISIIPDEETEEIKVNINNGSDKFIYQVGDGITSLIILMYTIFMEFDENQNKIFFIDEPENNFHPGYQKLFINMISSYKEFKNCIFIITTHSNHLLDTGRIENNSLIYFCQSLNEKIKVEERDSDYYDVLDELGVTASSVLLANKAIWIEGKYDALYIRKLLALKNINDNTKKKRYIEDYDYCFIPYGGKNMVLIDFDKSKNEFNEDMNEFVCKARKINSKYIVILDDDGMEDEVKVQKIKNYRKLLNTLGKKRVYKHEVREIENYFSEDVVKEFIKQNINTDYQIDEFIEKLNIKYDDYKNQNLGDYINKKITNIERGKDALKKVTNRKEGFKKDGALYDKQKFYNVVCEFFNKDNFEYETNVTQEAKNLIEFIEKFIKD